MAYCPMDPGRKNREMGAESSADNFSNKFVGAAEAEEE